MEELQTKLNELIQLRESYMVNARNDEALNDEIRELQAQIILSKLKKNKKTALDFNNTIKAMLPKK
jgi:DNA-binding transcriptional regulator LsrR (DeoR family)